MEKLFIETKYTGKVELPRDLLDNLPQKVMVATTIQFIDSLKEVKSRLAAFKKKIFFFTSIHGRYTGQILGCDNFKVRQDVDCFLYIGDGEFHPRALLVNEKPVFCYNPLSNRWSKFGRKEWEQLRLKKKVSLMKYHSAQKIGILISTKEGQMLMQGQVDKLKEQLESQGKEVYLFLGNELKDLENYPFIDCWVNTACPRISDDVKGMVNIRDL